MNKGRTPFKGRREERKPSVWGEKKLAVFNISKKKKKEKRDSIH